MAEAKYIAHLAPFALRNGSKFIGIYGDDAGGIDPRCWKRCLDAGINKSTG